MQQTLTNTFSAPKLSACVLVPILPLSDTAAFAKCFKHSAKLRKHSTNPLPSVTLGKEVSANYTSAATSLSSTFCRALSKEKSPSRHQAKVTEPLSGILLDSRQRLSLCRVPVGLALEKEGSSGSFC
jgi:hypothetical protein